VLVVCLLLAPTPKPSFLEHSHIPDAVVLREVVGGDEAVSLRTLKATAADLHGSQRRRPPRLHDMKETRTMSVVAGGATVFTTT
jgi:hypothetical protein